MYNMQAFWISEAVFSIRRFMLQLLTEISLSNNNKLIILTDVTPIAICCT